MSCWYDCSNVVICVSSEAEMHREANRAILTRDELTGYCCIPTSLWYRSSIESNKYYRKILDVALQLS